MYRYSRPPSRWPRIALIVVVAIAIILAGLVLFGLPRVTSFSPQGDSVSARAPIQITFSAGMNAATVESGLHVEPVVAGTFRWQENTFSFTPAADWPTGAVRVSLRGAIDANGLPVLFESRWEFTVGAPRIAFLLRTGDAANIWTMPVTGGEPTQITTERFGVDRFAISPDGTQFAFAALRADGGADLKRSGRDGDGVTGLLDCPSDRCTAPAFSPDGNLIAFERHPLNRLDQSSVEVIDLRDNSRTTLDGDPAHLARFPTFARDGRLAYLSAFEQVIVVHDFATGDSIRIPNTSGEMASWSPDGQYLVFAEITTAPPPTTAPGTPVPELQIDTFFSHLWRVAVGTGLGDDLSGGAPVEDAAAVYSPFGDWLAFGRKSLEQDKWTPGRQLWLMRSDGSDAQALTNDPLYNHSHFVWSPDGKLIVYVRFDVSDPASTTEIWSVSANGAGAMKLVTGGYLPAWLP
jgi:Tol biopolymer transport system component